jgi:DNA-binding response OmpR family regulator
MEMALVLVIEDDALMRATIRRMLASHTVIEASNGREGLAAFKLRAPDIVITDILMPEKEGIETIIELRAASSLSKIIAISGGGSSGTLDFLTSAKKLGADLVMHKPLRAAELLAAVESLCADNSNGDQQS